jgi:transcriptional regulator NrdR family protein
MVKCPYCDYEGEFKLIKNWRFRFYDVKRLECPKCNGRFNYYVGVSVKGKTSKFVIKVKHKK